MHFAVGTKNKPKGQAVESVLGSSLYTNNTPYSISYHAVSSGVSDMPTTLEELRTGAKNRVVYTRGERENADYFIGMEGGIYKDYEGEDYWYLGVVYIENHDGCGYFGYSAHLRVPDTVVDLLFDGRNLDLEQVMREISGEENVGDKQGSGAIWSDGLLTRQEQFILATKCALVPHFSLFYR